jgi:branched-chain amino acid transport system substrate-binding protein
MGIYLSTLPRKERTMKTKMLFYSILSVVLMQIPVGGAIAVPPAPQNIPVGVLISLSGFDSNIGHQAKAGYEIAAEEINRTGGIFVKEYGKKIPLELIVQDMESSPTKAVSRMEWLYTAKKVLAYVGTTMVATTGTGVAEKNKIPTIVVASPRQIHHDRGLKYWFSPTAKTPDNARIIFDSFESTIPAEKRPKTIAMFQEQADFGIEQAEFLMKEAVQRGYKIVAHEKYSQMSKDLSPMILSAKNAGAEAVLSCPVTPDAMLMMRQMKELDYNPKMIVLIRGAEDLAWGKALGPIGDYVIMNSWHHGVRYPGVDKLNAVHQSKFGRPADMQTGPGYASIQILAAAIEKAGTLDTAKIRDAIAATDMMTVAGKIKFRPNGTPIDPCPAVVQWLAGSQKLVWPKEFRETPLVYPIPPWKER